MEVQQIASSTEKEYKKRLRTNSNHIYAINLVSDLHARIDNVVSSVKSRGIKFGCDKGCSHCCNLRVEALAPEVFYIAKKLISERSREEFGDLVKVLEEYSSKAKRLRTVEHLLTCPLLSDGKCTIYKYRPFMCRKYNSLDASVCEDLFSEVPENIEIVVKSGAIGYGFSEAFTTKKLSSIPHELGQALLIALTDSSAETRWSKGEMVFEPIPEMDGL